MFSCQSAAQISCQGCKASTDQQCYDLEEAAQKTGTAFSCQSAAQLRCQGCKASTSQQCFEQEEVTKKTGTAFYRQLSAQLLCQRCQVSTAYKCLDRFDQEEAEKRPVRHFLFNLLCNFPPLAARQVPHTSVLITRRIPQILIRYFHVNDERYPWSCITTTIVCSVAHYVDTISILKVVLH